jgi:DNA polymerase-1
MIRRPLSDFISRRLTAGTARNAEQRLSLVNAEATFRRQHRIQNTGRIFAQSFSTRLQPLKATVVEEDSADTSLHSNQRIDVESRNGASIDTALESEEDLFEGLSSRPVKGGTWNLRAPVAWAKDFGGRSAEYAASLQSLIRLKPGDEGYFDASDLKIPKVTIVRTKEEAKIVMEKLRNADTSILHACDTEVMDINLKEVGPIGNGYVTCASVYSGPDFDYGLGDGPGTTLWIDNLDDACGILQEFKEWFEDPTRYKVWHNYGFDRHVMWNEGIDCQGFGGDTMHMARLQDTSRAKYGEGLGYSLEALTHTILDMRKRPMKEIFGVPRLRKDGTPGSMIDLPPIDILQRDPKFRKNFILYSCYDAEGTWRLHEKLVEMLKQMSWLSNGKNLYDYYWDNMREFGKVLTDMERRGVLVDAKDYLASVEVQARKDRQQHSETFREWAVKKIGPDGLALNPASSLQLGILLFGGAMNTKTKEKTETRRVLKVKREEIPEYALDAYKKRDEEEQAANTQGELFRFSVPLI